FVLSSRKAVYFSTDGVTWTGQSADLWDAVIHHDGNRWVALDAGGGDVKTSTDLVTWKDVSEIDPGLSAKGTTDTIGGFAHVDGWYYYLTFDGELRRSQDLKSWTDVGTYDSYQLFGRTVA